MPCGSPRKQRDAAAKPSARAGSGRPSSAAIRTAGSTALDDSAKSLSIMNTPVCSAYAATSSGPGGSCSSSESASAIVSSGVGRRAPRAPTRVPSARVRRQPPLPGRDRGRLLPRGRPSTPPVGPAWCTARAHCSRSVARSGCPAGACVERTARGLPPLPRCRGRARDRRRGQGSASRCLQLLDAARRPRARELERSAGSGGRARRRGPRRARRPAARSRPRPPGAVGPAARGIWA